MSKSWMAVALCAPLGVASAMLRAQAPPAGAADLVVHNATIYTVDANQPRAQALAVRGSRLVVVGSNADALALRGPNTRVIDAGGRAIVPGLQDAHAHFTGLGAALQVLDLRGTASLDEIVALVQKKVATARPGEWILGRSWDQNDWPVKEWPTHAALDRVAPDNPVYLTRVDGHAAYANAKAMQLAGITAATRDPEGGRLIRDAAGQPTGVFIDKATGLVSSRIPHATTQQLEEQILLADARTRELGLTMVHDAGTSGEIVEAYKRLADAGKLKTRLYVMLGMPLAQLKPYFEKGPVASYADHRIAVRAVKVVADGALGSRGAAMLAPYSDEPGTSGLLLLPPEQVYEITVAAARAGFQTCIHAIGDRANRIVLDTFERVEREVPAARDLRLRDEHAQILDPAEIPRFARLGVIAAMQATHATSDMPWVPARIGPERTAAGAYVWQKLMKTGVVVANGSDFPVEEPNPMLGLYAAITRQDREGRPPGGWFPDQRMTREEALASFTINAAYAAHAERDLGSLVPGKLADFVLLSDDVMQVPAPQILATRPLLTVVGGEIVWTTLTKG